MKSFSKHEGVVALLDRVNVDTDQIIPKQFLKRIERTGFEDALFFDWRFKPDGSLNETFELNQPRFRNASILLARANFGCGSSREHAPWALSDYGFTVVIAPSFADIFYNNCFKNGLLPIALSEEQVEDIFERARDIEGYRLAVESRMVRRLRPTTDWKLTSRSTRFAASVYSRVSMILASRCNRAKASAAMSNGSRSAARAQTFCLGAPASGRPRAAEATRWE